VRIEGAFDHRVVCGDDEQLILVDSADREIGCVSKADAHRKDGTLHRAFSVFVFNPAGELLVQRRAAEKRLWPGYWSNSCCSHPHRGETMEDAIRRRLDEELGLSAKLEFLFKFRYRSQYDAGGAEHELCSVYWGSCADRPCVNINEIAAWRYLCPRALRAEIHAAPERFTPWFKIEWARIERTHPWILASR
jgi:isopentenyl-diphosphate delta-isomerase